jgi:hypothetical protein
VSFRRGDRWGWGYLPRNGNYNKVVVVPEPMDFGEQDPAFRRNRDGFAWTLRIAAKGVMSQLFEKGYAVWLVQPCLSYAGTS